MKFVHRVPTAPTAGLVREDFREEQSLASLDAPTSCLAFHISAMSFESTMYLLCKLHALKGLTGPKNPYLLAEKHKSHAANVIVLQVFHGVRMVNWKR